MPLISVIIPVYNVEPYLRECLDSVRAQTFRDLEVICIDDGSVDASGAICDQYALRDRRIHTIHQDNGGLSAARNTGMDVATGEYIYFLDSDDMLAPNALERLISIAKSERLDQIIFGAELLVEEDVVSNEQIAGMRRYYAVPDALANHVMSGANLFSALIECNSFFASVPLRFLRRANLPKKLRFPHGILHEDNYFSPIALLASTRAMIISERLYLRRVRADSIMTASGTMRKHAEGLQCIYKLLTPRRLKDMIGVNQPWKELKQFRRVLYQSFLRYNPEPRSLTMRIVDDFRLLPYSIAVKRWARKFLQKIGLYDMSLKIWHIMRSED